MEEQYSLTSYLDSRESILAITVRLKSITINSGQTVELPRAGVICIVGGNNVGKSQLLREIEEHYSNNIKTERRVLSDITLEKSNITPNDIDVF